MLLIAEAAANLHMLHIFPSEGRTSHKSATIISKHFKCFPLEWLLIEIAQKYVLHINSLWNKSTCVKNMHKMEECTVTMIVPWKHIFVVELLKLQAGCI